MISTYNKIQNNPKPNYICTTNINLAYLPRIIHTYKICICLCIQLHNIRMHIM